MLHDSSIDSTPPPVSPNFSPIPVVRAFSASSTPFTPPSPSPCSSLVGQEAKNKNGSVGGKGRGGKARFQAIVNAANLACLGGKGVDGAIHAAAGPELKTLCEQLPEVRSGVRCPWGDAKITASGKLPPPIRYVIHAVGPIHPASEFWGDKRSKWQIDFAPSQVGKLLRSAYDASFAQCVENGIQSVGFPAISCGVFGFPYEAATRIALEAILAHASCPSPLQRVLLVGLEQPAWDAYTIVCNSLVEQGVLREAAVDHLPIPVAVPVPSNPVPAPAQTSESASEGQAVIHTRPVAGTSLSQSARRRLRKQKQESLR